MLLSNSRLSSDSGVPEPSNEVNPFPNNPPPVTRSSQQKRKSEVFRTPSTKIIRRCNEAEDEPPVNIPQGEILVEEDDPRPSPLPPIKFADGFGLWELMCETDMKYTRDSDPFKNHPALGPPMRAILIDWLMDVSEAYNLHRETLYLAIDYLDRYLSTEENLRKDHLQLVGISCLFVASKVEEIYPPKLTTFAYVTDGACTEADIVSTEMLIMKTLKWNLSPITPCNWVNVYLQVLSHTTNVNENRPMTTPKRTSPRSRPIQLHRDINKSLAFEGELFLWPQYSGVDFVRALRILDLACLDIKFLNFKYSILGAAAVYHIKGKEASVKTSSYQWELIAPCANWMAPFAQVVKRSDITDVLPSLPNVPDTNRHLIQSHCVSLSMLERVQILQNSNKLLSPIISSDGLLTPPRSNEKYVRQKQ